MNLINLLDFDDIHSFLRMDKKSFYELLSNVVDRHVRLRWPLQRDCRSRGFKQAARRFQTNASASGLKRKPCCQGRLKVKRNLV